MIWERKKFLVVADKRLFASLNCDQLKTCLIPYMLLRSKQFGNALAEISQCPVLKIFDLVMLLVCFTDRSFCLVKAFL